MTETTFNYFHPDFMEWADQIDWDLRYDESASAAAVMNAMLDLGFTITPPLMPRYVLTYNGHAEFRSDKKENVEQFLYGIRKAGSTIGWEIRDRQEAAP